MKKQVVVFVTSEICVLSPPFKGAVPKYTLNEGSNGQVMYAFYSTGRLEKAIKDDCDVWILNTTPLDQPQTQWWYDLVNSEKILDLTDFLDIESQKALGVMFLLYERLNLKWDKAVKYWHSARYAMLNMGVKLGFQIKPDLPA